MGMGNCIGIYNIENENSVRTTNDQPNQLENNSRKNHPLCHETIRWRSDVPLTEGQLRSKRDEFWETAPAFDGRREIWDALKAASRAAESLDFVLAQAILDGANISVPNGYITECYDELGTQYKIPIYCLSYPINIVLEDFGRDSPAEYSEPINGGSEVTLKLRLSSSMEDVKIIVFSKDTVSNCKRKLQMLEKVDYCCQRWFYAGKLLSDKMLIEEANIQNGYIIQVVVNTEHTNHDSINIKFKTDIEAKYS
ncbi:UBTD2 family protein [Megaselia abdita]